MSFKKQKKKRKSPIKDWRKAKKKKKKRKFPDQRLEESERKKKKISRSKIGRKQKQNIQKGRWTRQCLNNVQNCHKQERKEKKPPLETHKAPPSGYQPNRCARVTFAPR